VDQARIFLSVIAPVRDEESNLIPLYERVRDALAGVPGWELLLVDDASSDASRDVILGLCKQDPRVRGARLARHAGQSSAICAGIDLARGERIATIDADLQNDPADLLVLLDAMGDADAVVGYRRRRRDGWVKRASSRIANRIRDVVSGDRVTDTGCSLKLFRAGAIRALPRFEGMHRFLPTLLRQAGFRVVEVPVSHHPRTAGRSKYGIANRALPGFLDLLAVRWMRSRRICTSVHEIRGQAGPP
jgi:glycosyltransferase involved in cell wall biosynthesis